MYRLSRVLIAAVLATSLTAGMTGQAGAGPGPDRLVDLRVCGATTFSRVENRCTRDERRLPITSNRISCSVTLVSQHSGAWLVRFTFGGHVEPWTRGGTISKGSSRLTYKTNIGINLPVPGGNWRCEFAFGSAHASVAFTSGGPTGEIVDTAVCPRSDVLSFGSKRTEKRCAKDDSGTPLPVSQRIYCSAVYAHPASKTARIEFLRADGTLLATWKLTIAWPTVSQGFGYVDPSVLSSPGNYLCRFQLGHGTTIDKPFQVGHVR
jgi:hypothetical protein